MPRLGTMLTDAKVRALLKAEKKSKVYDGEGKGLSLVLGGTGLGSWLLRVRVDGERCDYGLGSIRDVSLVEARRLTNQYRQWIREGKNPKSELRRLRSERSVPTVREAAAVSIKVRTSEWKNQERQLKQWQSRFDKYIPYSVKEMPVTDVRRRHIIEILDPIWVNQNSTATNVRSDLAAIFNWAIEEEIRADNPALVSMKTALKKPKPPVHRKALHYTEVASAFKAFEKTGATDSMKLMCKLMFLTVLRVSEVVYARWSEIQFDKGHWVIPSERMKRARPHTLPVTPLMIAVFEEARGLESTDPDIVFPGRSKDGFLTPTGLPQQFRVHQLGMHPHGIRTSFRNWCAETGVDHIQAEICLHHQVGDSTIRAYFRTELVEQRRQILIDWGALLFGNQD